MGTIPMNDRRSRCFALILFLMLGALSAATATRIPAAHAQPTGTHFDHVVIVAMENEPESIIGSSSTPFLNSLLAAGTTLAHADQYSDNVNCSAGCYVEFTSGLANGGGVGDGWSCCLTTTTIVDQMASAGMTWQAYCAEGCPRGLDHFPFNGYTSDQGSPNIFTSSSVTTSTFFAAANSATPPNYLWYTPTDSENMHDNSISSGDSYLKNFLVGPSGSLASPASGSLLASNVFTNSNFHTLLWIWFDECGSSDGGPSCDSNSDAANVEYGPHAGLKTNYASQSSYTTFSELAMLEDNWGLQRLGSAAGAAAVTDIFGTSGPSPLAVSYSYSPSTVTVGTPEKFTAQASGGTGTGYSYTWSFGGTVGTQTGNPVTVTFSTANTRSISVSVTDSGAHTASASQTVTINPSCTGSSCGGCTSNCNTGIGSKDNPPQLLGWGGIRLDEAAVGAGGLNPNTSTEASCCFSGETATNMQLALERAQSLGYNAVRVEFDPICTDDQDYQYMSAYSAANLQRAITIAEHYNFWIIVDYHGYVDALPTTSAPDSNTGPSSLIVSGYSTLQSCWLGEWASIVTQFKNSYNKIVWEPLNEPYDITVPQLSAAYQAWVTQDRAIGDSHWIVIGNLCSNTCSFGDFAQGQPTVSDPDNLLFSNLHAYIGFPYVSPWTNSEADSYATQTFEWMQEAARNTGWPSLSTEVGADPLCDSNPNSGEAPCNGDPGWGSCANPPVTCDGSAGYTTVSLEFVKHLTSLIDSASPAMGWIGWTAGSWTDSPGSPILGALDPTYWGTQLGTVTVCSTCGNSGGGSSTSFLNLLLSNPVALGLIGVVGLVVGVAAFASGGKKRSAHSSK
jgi:phosphatidylinositol-3-phosphatase